MTGATNDTTVYIDGPTGKGIPADVFATLARLISLAYPGARMGAGRGGQGWALIIPEASRHAAPVTDEEATSAKEPMDPALGDEGGFTGFDGINLSMIPPREAMKVLTHLAYTVLTTSGENGGSVANYVEQSAANSEGRHFTISIAWTEGQTPHQLRRAVEAELERANQRVAELEANLAAPAQEAPKEDTKRVGQDPPS